MNMMFDTIAGHAGRCVNTVIITKINNASSPLTSLQRTGILRPPSFLSPLPPSLKYLIHTADPSFTAKVQYSNPSLTIIITFYILN